VGFLAIGKPQLVTVCEGTSNFRAINSAGI
jgi:hypothetical protein